MNNITRIVVYALMTVGLGVLFVWAVNDGGNRGQASYDRMICRSADKSGNLDTYRSNNCDNVDWRIE